MDTLDPTTEPWTLDRAITDEEYAMRESALVDMERELDYVLSMRTEERAYWFGPEVD